jgi:hypothetical protein
MSENLTIRPIEVRFGDEHPRFTRGMKGSMAGQRQPVYGGFCARRGDEHEWFHFNVGDVVPTNPEDFVRWLVQENGIPPGFAETVWDAMFADGGFYGPGLKWVSTKQFAEILEGQPRAAWAERVWRAIKNTGVCT